MLFTYTITAPKDTTREQADELVRDEIAKRVAKGFAAPAGRVIAKRTGGSRFGVRGGNVVITKPYTLYVLEFTGDV